MKLKHERNSQMQPFNLHLFYFIFVFLNIFYILFFLIKSSTFIKYELDLDY
jgi:hypothetical protein